MDVTFKFYFECLNKALKGETIKEIPNGVDYKKLFLTATRQGVVVILSFALKDILELCPENFRIAIKKAVSKETMKDIQSEYDKNIVIKALEENSIDFMPMKGYFLKNLYPTPEMRYCSDFDILVDSKKIKQVKRLLISLGLEMDHSDTHHDVFFFPKTKTIFEIHKLLFVGPLEKYFGVGFERASLKEGYKHFYELSKNDFYISVLAHYAYHFEEGAGVGAKSLCDLYVLEKNYCLDHCYIDEELKKCGLLNFKEKYLKALSVIFNNEKSDEFTNKLLEAIFNSGYLENKSKNLVNKTARQGEDISKAKKSALIKRIFPPKEHIYFTYPFIKKVKLLLPLGYFLRLIRGIFKSPKKIKEISSINAITQAELDEMRYIRKGLGLK